jgi:hypothetical protein
VCLVTECKVPGSVLSPDLHNNGDDDGNFFRFAICYTPLVLLPPGPWLCRLLRSLCVGYTILRLTADRKIPGSGLSLNLRKIIVVLMMMMIIIITYYFLSSCHQLHFSYFLWPRWLRLQLRNLRMHYMASVATTVDDSANALLVNYCFSDTGLRARMSDSISE